MPPRTVERKQAQGQGWAVLLEAHEDYRRRTLTRKITSFRQVGRSYRRTDETHVVRLYSASVLQGVLERTGFRTRVVQRYGRFPLLPGRAAMIAVKP